MTAKAVKDGIGFANAAANVLRLAAATIGPPMLRLYGDDKDGKPFSGLVEHDRSAVLPFGPPQGGPQGQRAANNGPPITYVCGTCHADDVAVQVESYWDDKAQDWRACRDGSMGEAECSRCGPTMLMQRLLRP